MQSLAEFSNDYLIQPDLAFLNKLLQLQSAYYSGGYQTAVLKELLQELCNITDSTAAGLINNRDRLLDVFINNGQKSLVHATLKRMEDNKRKLYHIKKAGNQSMLICGIKDEHGLVGMLYLTGPPGIYTADTYLKIKPAIPVLNGMVAYMDLYNSAPEMAVQEKKIAKLETLIESMDDVILELDAKMVIRKVWAKDKNKLFMVPELFLNKTLSEIMGGFADIFIECIEHLIATGEKQECIYPDFDLNKDHWYSAKFHKIDAESGHEEVRVICVIEDITSRKLISDQLQHRTIELKRINNLLDIGMDISMMGGWEYHLLTRDLFVTRQINDIKDLGIDVVLNPRSILTFYDLENKNHLLNTLNEALQQGHSFDIELELTSAKNFKKWVRVAGVPVFENNKIQSFRGILKDISHHKKSKQELIAAKNLAEQIARKRTEILSIMSHEIRTPLNGIIGICNLLDQVDIADPATREYINHLNFSSNHLLDLVNDILDLEKMENRKMELHEHEVNLVAFVENIRRQLLSLAEAKDLALNFYHDGDLPETVQLDELRLGRILNNLIGNAIKFTEEGRIDITLTTISQQAGQVRIGFKIEDTGIGIPEHLHEHVFDRFHQVQQASHRQQQGTGLGLSITKGLVNLFGSEIYLHSKPNEGTTFEFEIDFLTIGNTEPLMLNKGKKQGLSALPYLKLLIVDDNPVNLLVAKRQVNHFGLEAEQAESGYEALNMLKEQQFDIILIDLHMPGMDGYQLARQVQLDYPDTKVIIFTADILEEVRVRLKEMGLPHLLSKPFNPEEMHEMLLEVIGGNR